MVVLYSIEGRRGLERGREEYAFSRKWLKLKTAYKSLS